MLTIFENACMRGTWALNEKVWRLDKTNANLIACCYVERKGFYVNYFRKCLYEGDLGFE